LASRRVLFIILAVLGVILLLVGIALWAASGKAAPPGNDDEDRIMRKGPPPEVTFAPNAASGNAELDAFVKRFITICLDGKYEQYRLCWTAYADPISRARFQAAWNRVSKVVIKRIAPAPEEIKARRPAYLVAVTVYLRPPAKATQKNLYVLVQREADRWAVAPAPKRDVISGNGSQAIPIGEP